MGRREKSLFEVLSVVLLGRSPLLGANEQDRKDQIARLGSSQMGKKWIGERIRKYCATWDFEKVGLHLNKQNYSNCAGIHIFEHEVQEGSF